MKKLGLFLLCIFMLWGCQHREDPSLNLKIDMSERLITTSENTDVSALAEIISPAVVGVLSTNISNQSIGAGVCVAEGGYIITNSHVIAYPNNIILHLYNGETCSAELVYEDSSLDFAILKSSVQLPYLKMSEVDNVLVGEDVLAVGTPLSLLLKHSFTKGIISATNRTLKVSSLSGESYMQNLIQHDASLNPGNSGGPLINMRGEVVGINTLKISSSEGLGFAIPIKSFYSLLSSMVENINYTAPYLGAYGYDAEIANYYQKCRAEKGFYIIQLAGNSPLKNAGLQQGDVIKKINGVEITNVLDLRHELFKYSSGDIVEIEYENKNKNTTVNINLEKHPVNVNHYNNR